VKCYSCQVRPVYLDLSKPTITPDILNGWDHVSLFCLDNFDSVSYMPEWQEAIFNLYNRRLSRDDGTQASLIVSSQTPLQESNIELKDLRSRLSSGLMFQLKSLNDEHMHLALRVHAEQRGLTLPHETVEFILKRLPRDLSILVENLNVFDQASLQAQRKLTIPFVKSLLEE